ncbi:S8 family serine peptidase [Eubacterium aggregans]|uniref:S8 family serine peptidase n=1 Tax=Eubacterium aggregans TaxID=81409 RepID=UPI003F38A150
MSANFTGEAYDSSDPMDDHSHGTHCTGIIGAQWNNLGVSGATTGTQIMAVKAADNLVAFQTSAIINGFSYIKAALKAGVQVKAINNSWGGSAGGQSVNMAITEVGKLSAISVFASGNKSINTDTQSSTCSTLKDNPYVVVVNATDKDGNAAYFTNYGDRTTDVAAPGVNIFSTVQTDKGTADARYVTLVLKDDYNRKKVNGTLNYASSENPSKVVEISIAKGQGKDGGGSNALSIKNRTNDGEFTISRETPMEKSKYLVLRYKSTAENPAISISRFATKTKLKNGEWSELELQMQSKSDWHIVMFHLSEDTDFDAFSLQLGLAGINGELETLDGMSINIDNIILTNELFPYKYMNGTSMATPAVTGEAAILAAAFTDDTPEKRAARIIGSVTALSEGNQAGQSVSGGLVQVDKALAEATVPVLNSAVVTDTNTLTITWYFFGAKQGTVAIDDQAVDVKTWGDEEITVELPAGMAGGEKCMTVTSDQGSGHQYYEIGETANLYKRIRLPSVEENPGFYTLTGKSLYGLKGHLYYMGSGAEDYLEIWQDT